METLRIAKLSPTENMTVLVETPMERARHAAVAERLMKEGGVGCEQVGFIEKPENPAARARLQMMGGEFCGNATMSLAALLCQRDGLRAGEKAAVPLEVSGAQHLLTCRICALEDGFEGTVDMPLPKKVETRTLFFEDEAFAVTAVWLDGIVHLILPRRNISPMQAERTLRAWAKEIDEEAVGLLLMDPATQTIAPLVYVKPTDSAVWERGCGSGSAAVGAYRALCAGEGETVTRVNQPGGVITVCAAVRNGRVESLSITGLVRIVLCGEAYL